MPDILENAMTTLVAPGLGTAEFFVAVLVACGLAMIAMHFARCFHPPAGIDPLIVVHNDLSWGFLLMPVAAGAVLLAAFAFAWHNLLRRGGWPARSNR